MSDTNNLGWHILREIERDHEWREQNPALFFAKLCEDLWRTTPEDEWLNVFEIRVRNAVWWASDALACVEKVVAEQPAWAAPALESFADEWFGSSAEETPQPYLDLLAERAAEMRSVFDSA
ncbi:hypothetical protein [Streptomyces sp. NPDC059278]|uniref:hypothetical protein n=1 Tax=Streptomyces sp. NPDC059278 TaxID=3346801 RepID=UPI00368F7EEE